MSTTSIEAELDTATATGLANPIVGNALTLAAGLGIFVLGIVLPLVGPAAALTDHYAANRISFHTVTFVALALSVLALVSKLSRRKVDGSPFPKASSFLVGWYALILLLEISGALAI